MKDLLTIMSLSAQQAMQKLHEYNQSIWYRFESYSRGGEIESILNLTSAHKIDMERLARILDLYESDVKIESEDDNSIRYVFYYNNLKVSAYIFKDKDK